MSAFAVRWAGLASRAPHRCNRTRGDKGARASGFPRGSRGHEPISIPEAGCDAYPCCEPSSRTVCPKHLLISLYHGVRTSKTPCERQTRNESPRRRHDSTFVYRGRDPGPGTPTRVDRRDRRKRFAVRATDAPRATTRTGSDRHRPPRPPGSGSHSIPLSGIRGAQHPAWRVRSGRGGLGVVGGRGGTGTSTARPRRRRDETARRAAARARDAVRRGVLLGASPKYSSRIGFICRKLIAQTRYCRFVRS
jgi:hypothetical protein